MTPARFRWGTILITLGLLLLLRNLDYFNDDLWFDLILYFPLVLIAIGIEKIFTRTRLQFISYATSVCLIFAALAIAVHSQSDSAIGSYFHTTTHQANADPSVDFIDAELNLNETNLTIRDSGKDLVYGRFDRFTRKPKITFRTENDTAFLAYNARPGSYLGGAVKINVGEGQDWYVRFSEDVPLRLRCSGHDDDMHLNFSTTPLENLALDAENATIYLKLGDRQPNVTVTVGGEGSSLKLRLPSGIGLSVSGQEYRDYLERLGFIQSGEAYVTEGFDTASTRIDVDLESQLSSFSVDFF